MVQERLLARARVARRRLRGKGVRPSRQAKNLTLDARSGPSRGSGPCPGRLAFTEAVAERFFGREAAVEGDAAALPGGVPPAELRDYLRDLIDRLVRLAHP
jgi:hypothetical protein